MLFENFQQLISADEILKASGASPNPENQGSAGAVHAQSSGSAVQFVVVQQNPADDDRASLGKFVERLRGTVLVSP